MESQNIQYEYCIKCKNFKEVSIQTNPNFDCKSVSVNFFIDKFKEF